MAGNIETLLLSLGLIHADTVSEFFPRVRDREDVRVLRCARSGIIFLSRSDHMDARHYEEAGLAYWSASTRQQVLAECREDDARRGRDYGHLIRGKRWLDVGTGAGGILELIGASAEEVAAVEPQAEIRAELERCGYAAHKAIHDVPDGHFDVITLFHVFEHMLDPIGDLALIRRKLKPGGRVIVEVPHANDFLLTFLEVEAFKRFTFWSEHLILHTRQSLDVFVREAGFAEISVVGVQRYPLANHMHWVARGKPGGHKTWALLSSSELDQAYGDLLARLDRTDTLTAIATATHP
jgi:2-polyprenyl-3-methyl-5-hydroxy-6-metoxy-1,4-benzoquinol methylase